MHINTFLVQINTDLAIQPWLSSDPFFPFETRTKDTDAVAEAWSQQSVYVAREPSFRKECGPSQKIGHMLVYIIGHPQDETCSENMLTLHYFAI